MKNKASQPAAGSRSSQADPGLGTDYQAAAGEVFQVSDVFAQRGLGEQHFPCRLGKAPLLYKTHKRLHLLEGDEPELIGYHGHA